MQLDAWLRAGEAQHPDLRPGTGKGIVWHGSVGQRTPWAVVYLHGFSASRQEVAPLPERVAQALGANVYYARLSGNGRSGMAMGEATVQDWLADTVEAARIGRLIGDKVLFVATSTGGTLGTWLATRPEGLAISAYAFISPNYGPKDKRSELINGPWGQQLALALEGEMRGQPSSDPREEAAWTTRYATRALFPMMALVKHVRQSDLSAFKAPVLVLYSAGDQTVDPEETQQVFARLGSAQKTLEAVTYSEAKGQHVLAGDIRAPKATEPMAQRVVAWVKSLSL
jgi:esterase/lipase